MKWEYPGIDPYNVGLDGERPVYNDGRESISLTFNISDEMAKLDAMLTTKSSDELELDTTTIRDLGSRIDEYDATRMQDYLRFRVLQKHEGETGLNYQFLPGSIMYGLALDFIRQPGQEFLAMLPLISPLVIDRYKEANPGVEF